VLLHDLGHAGEQPCRRWSGSTMVSAGWRASTARSPTRIRWGRRTWHRRRCRRQSRRRWGRGRRRVVRVLPGEPAVAAAAEDAVVEGQVPLAVAGFEGANLVLVAGAGRLSRGGALRHGKLRVAGVSIDAGSGYCYNRVSGRYSGTAADSFDCTGSRRPPSSRPGPGAGWRRGSGESARCGAAGAD